MTSENKNFSPRLSKRLLYGVQLICALLGLAVSIYLLVQHTRLKSGAQAGQSFCNLGAHMDCDAVNTSSFSEIFGIPLASLGAPFYFLILMLGIWARPRAKGFYFFQRVIAWLTLAGLLVDLFLLGVQALQLQNFCLMCLTTYVATIGVLFSSVILQATGRTESFGFLKKAFSAPLPERAPVPASAVIIITISLVCFVTVIALLPSSIRIKSSPYAMVDDATEAFFQKWKDFPIRKIPVKEGDGTFGNSGSKVQIVEFSDFQCPHCLKAAFTLHTALESFDGRIFFVFKNYPLDNNCNPKVTFQMHQYACKLARMAYCANEKGKFWPFHDAVFFKWQETENNAGATAKDRDSVLDAVKKGPFSEFFTLSEYNQCLASSSSLDNTKEDIQLGDSLMVGGTPTVFINGKPVTIPITLENLKRLIEIEEQL